MKRTAPIDVTAVAIKRQIVRNAPESRSVPFALRQLAYQLAVFSVKLLSMEVENRLQIAV